VPYHAEDSVTIYHGESAMILPMLVRYDLLLTDPKYGISADAVAARTALDRIKSGGKTKAGRGWKYYGESNWDDERTPRWLLEMALSRCEEAIVWGGNYFTDCLPPRMGWSGTRCSATSR
jgi:site-specific DNA-methyltransferase (adenine-specific)